MLKLEDNREVLLNNVRRVPETRRNLISVEMLDEIGCMITVNEGSLKVLEEFRTIFEAPKQNDLYIIKKCSV